MQGRPAQPLHSEAPFPGQSGLHELGNALRTFNPRLENLLEKWQAQQREEATKRYASELTQVGDNDLDKWHAEKNQGLSEEEQDALNTQFGIRLANARRRQEQYALESGELDPANVDMDQRIKTLMDSDINTYDSAAFTRALLRHGADCRELTCQISVKASGQKVRDEMEQGFFSLVSDAIQEVRDHGEDGAAVHKAIEGIRQAHGPGTAFNLSHERMDDLLMVALEGQARSGDEGGGLHILETSAERDSLWRLPRNGRSRWPI